jgi:predicted nucleotidyltransferase
MIDEATIEEAGRRIAAAAPAGARVILFGSHARGEADAKSDVDFLVIEPRVKSISAESTRLLETLDGMRLPADVVVFDQRTADRWARVAGTVVSRALREGRILAGARD